MVTCQAFNQCPNSNLSERIRAAIKMTAEITVSFSENESFLCFYPEDVTLYYRKRQLNRVIEPGQSQWVDEARARVLENMEELKNAIVQAEQDYLEAFAANYDR